MLAFEHNCELGSEKQHRKQWKNNIELPGDGLYNIFNEKID